MKTTSGRVTVRTVKGRVHRVRMKDGTFVRFIPTTENGRVVLDFPDADPEAKVERDKAGDGAREAISEKLSESVRTDIDRGR